MQGNAIDSNLIVTIHSRKNAISKLLADAVRSESKGLGGMYYWNKNEAIKIANGIGVQFPGSSTINDSFICSIYDPLLIVNAKIKNIFETKQFKRWFGKSKAVNKDGTPKMVYHGTSERFTVYDYLVSEGYDGIIVDDMGEGYTEYIVFKPEQIKSVADTPPCHAKSFSIYPSCGARRSGSSRIHTKRNRYRKSGICSFGGEGGTRSRYFSSVLAGLRIFYTISTQYTA